MFLTNLPDRIMEINKINLNNAVPTFNLAPFEYQKQLRDHLKNRKKTWDWFSRKDLKTKQIEEFKSGLLKNTYRLDAEAYKELYLTCAEVCQKLAIDAEVTLYQENNSVHLNAGISIIKKEAHIVLSGNLIGLLNSEEMKSVLAHELSHYLFYRVDNEEFETTQRIIVALANDSRSDDAMIETARKFQLYTELFCDAGSLLVCGNHTVVIQTLLKLNTGLTQVNAESYLEQAREIIDGDKKASSNTTHPEAYIRSLALQLRSEQNPDYFDKVVQMIEGELDLNHLDIFDQVEMLDMTHKLVQIILKPKWMNSSPVVNLATQYFQNFYRKNETQDLNIFRDEILKTDESVQNYLCYVLLDFSMVDTDLENGPLAHVLEISELLGLNELLEKLTRKEFKLTVRDFKLLKDKAITELQSVKEAKEDSIYNEH